MDTDFQPRALTPVYKMPPKTLKNEINEEQQTTSQCAECRKDIHFRNSRVCFDCHAGLKAQINILESRLRNIERIAKEGRK